MCFLFDAAGSMPFFVLTSSCLELGVHGGNLALEHLLRQRSLQLERCRQQPVFRTELCGRQVHRLRRLEAFQAAFCRLQSASLMSRKYTVQEMHALTSCRTRLLR